MRTTFAIWGFFGLVINAMNCTSLFAHSVGVGQSAYVAAWILLWIGGMLFFGIGALMQGLGRLVPASTPAIAPAPTPAAMPVQDPAMAPLRWRDRDDYGIAGNK